MVRSKKNQKAGDNSEQIQAEIVYINKGITLAEMKLVIKEEIQLALKETSIVANAVAEERLNNYTQILLPKLVKANMIDSFSEPSIQILFRNTERTAICSEREMDYSILTELLIHRVKNKNDINKKASISKAIEIIDKISDDALLALTIFHSVTYFRPMTGDIDDGLDVLEDLFGKILANKELPTDTKWIDNLEVNGLVRISNFGGTKKLEDYYSQCLNGYNCTGISNNSPEYSNLVEELEKNKIPKNILVNNVLNNGYSRINIPTKSYIKNIIITEIFEENRIVSTPINEEQIGIINKAFSIYDNTANIKNGVKKNFIEKIKNHKNLDLICNWWNTNLTNISININSIGRAIAHTNAKSIDEKLPDLD